MSPWRILRLVVVSVLVGLLIGIILSGDENVSIGAWVAAAGLILVVAMTRELLESARVEFKPIIGVWRPKQPETVPEHAHDYRHLKMTLRGGLASSDSFERSLRPRLTDLAAYHLPRSHGIDFEHDTERVNEVLGDVEWLIDPAVEDRTPTHEEVGRFLDVIVGDQRGRVG